MSTGRGIDKKMDRYSAIKEEQNNAICSNTDGPRDCHTE